MKHIMRFAFLSVLILSLSASPVRAAFECVTDLQLADDEPGQKDLNTFCEEAGDGSPFDLHLTWTFDNTRWPGNNTGDACALFDTNGNGDADFALCVTVTGGAPATQHADSPRLFTCGDDRPDRCSNGVEDADGIFGSICQVNVGGEADDPFSGDPNHTGSICAGTDCPIEDTFVECWLEADDLPGVESCTDGRCSNIGGQLCDDRADPSTCDGHIISESVPEPSAALVFGVGALLFGMRLRKRR